ncbi:hypothetical protein B5G00_01880 [Blautia sp. An46]|nr:hypothetical protein B5G00_01880 [Blautia sp. An46]
MIFLGFTGDFGTCYNFHKHIREIHSIFSEKVQSTSSSQLRLFPDSPGSQINTPLTQVKSKRNS